MGQSQVRVWGHCWAGVSNPKWLGVSVRLRIGFKLTMGLMAGVKIEEGSNLVSELALGWRSEVDLGWYQV